MNNNNSHFTTGLLLGLILGGGVVFLLGTRTGKNLLKIISEQGMDGITDLLEEYDLSDLEEVEDIEDEPGDGVQKEESSSAKTTEGQEKSPKKHFFRRIRK